MGVLFEKSAPKPPQKLSSKRKVFIDRLWDRGGVIRKRRRGFGGIKGLRKRVSKIGKGVFSERGYPCGTRGISLHGSTAPTPPRGRFHRDPAAVNPHICVVGRGESFFIASQFTMLQTTQIFFYKIPLVGAKRAGRIGARANSAALTLTKVGNDLTPPLSVNKRL